MTNAKILYSDVCKDNKVYDQLKTMLNLEPLEHEFSYGYTYAMIEGVRFSINVDRHKTHAGNQYIKCYPENFCHKDFKIPMNVDIDFDKIIGKLSKIAQEVKQATIEREKQQEFRARIYKKFSEINKNEHIKLNIDSKGLLDVSGQYKRYYEASVSYSSIENDIQDIKEYFKNYEQEQKEIARIISILKEVK